jgi:hypothetical protein
MVPGAGRTRTRVRVLLREEDGPDRWGPPVCQRAERKGRRARELVGLGNGESKLGRAGRGRKRGKKEMVGRIKKEKEGEKELHSNAFEFKFEI